VILIYQEQFYHFHEVSFGIKNLYGGAGRGYGRGGRISTRVTSRPTTLRGTITKQSTIEPIRPRPTWSY